MKFRLFRKILLLLLVFTIHASSNITIAQTLSHAKERLAADALAVAYAECDQLLTKYQFSLDVENIELKEHLKELTSLKSQLELTINTRYKTEDQKSKLEHQVFTAKKKLSQCMKYQNILDAKAEEEKQKAKEDE